MNTRFLNIHAVLRGVLACSLLAGLLACSRPDARVRRSNLMEYLYPKGKTPLYPDPEGARLKLPLRVGVVFVPSGQGWRSEQSLPPVQEKALLDIVRRAFVGKPWVSEVRVIPSAYLMPEGGFQSVAQAARMFNVDVMALVSVDQIQYTNPKWYSFMYLSVVGAYTLHGDANDTQTLIDAAVYDVASRTFVLRAPGRSLVKGGSNPIDREEQLRRQSAQGMEMAMVDLAKNLDQEVASFKAEVARGERSDVDLIDRKGQSLRETGGHNWGGAFEWYEVLGGLILVVVSLRKRV